MLRVRPWNRLGLTVRWLNQEYVQEFPVELQPPVHMPIVYGPIDSPESVVQSFHKPGAKCHLCQKPFEVESHHALTVLTCPANCENGFWHVICLAKHLTHNEQELLPLNGLCPSCKSADLLWPDLLKNQKRLV
uniref:RING-type domain-containing protein n=1 Tax=Mesocestoides corti TaxID=53468 RepID=A0A5K3EIS9_MESCO